MDSANLASKLSSPLDIIGEINTKHEHAENQLIYYQDMLRQPEHKRFAEMTDSEVYEAIQHFAKERLIMNIAKAALEYLPCTQVGKIINESS